MLHQDYDTQRRRWLEFWNCENHDRPIIIATAPLPTAMQKPEISAPATLKERWENPQYVIAAARRAMENTYYGGEALPVLNPNLGPDILGAIAGCGIEYGADTSWAEPCVTDWDTHAPLRFDESNPWWKKIEAITRAAAEDANGDYLVGITDLHPGTDGLVSLRGPQELCYDLADYEEQIVPRSDELFAIHAEVYNRLTDIIAPHQEGSINWMGIWHPEKRWYVVGSDFSCMLSGADYEKFVVPGLQKELAFLQASIYHLDGPDALRHLDRILQFPNLNGVQWVYGAGQPSARHWVEVLRRIQSAGKLIQINCEPKDVVPLCEALRPEGMNLVVNGCKTPEEVMQILEAAARASRR